MIAAAPFASMSAGSVAIRRKCRRRAKERKVVVGAEFGVSGCVHLLDTVNVGPRLGLGIVPVIAGGDFLGELFG